jgi:bifunctional non-homologous end joining protein LigD
MRCLHACAGFLNIRASWKTGNRILTIILPAIPPDSKDKLVASKVAKGYRPDGGTATPYQQSGDEGRDTGIRCQLLNPVEKQEVSRLLIGRIHCLQEKHDGRRLMVRKCGDEITGINRRGLIVAITEPIRLAIEEIPLSSSTEAHPHHHRTRRQVGGKSQRA